MKEGLKIREKHSEINPELNGFLRYKNLGNPKEAIAVNLGHEIAGHVAQYLFNLPCRDEYANADMLLTEDYRDYQLKIFKAMLADKEYKKYYKQEKISKFEAKANLRRYNDYLVERGDTTYQEYFNQIKLSNQFIDVLAFEESFSSYPEGVRVEKILQHNGGFLNEIIDYISESNLSVCIIE